MDLEGRIEFIRKMLLSNDRLFSWKFRGRERIDSNCIWANELENFLFLDTTEDFDIAYAAMGEPFFYVNSLSLAWCILPFQELREDCIYVLGPVFLQDTDERTFKQRMDLNDMSVSSQIRLIRLIHEIPVIPHAQLSHCACIFYYALYEKSYSRWKLSGTFERTGMKPKAGNHKPFIEAHGSLQFEMQLQKDVENGNLDYDQTQEFASSSFDPSIPAGGSMCPWDPLRQAKDMIIVEITLVTRAAVRGGLDVDTAYSLSDYYIQQTELSNTEQEVYHIGRQMYDSFVHKVHDIQHAAPVSSVVRRCCSMIRENLLTGIEWDEIAHRLGYNPHYLSSKFKEEMGISFRDYIAQQKVEYAKTILPTSDILICDLAEMLGFSSESYFSRTFRKLTGTSPREYRKSGI